MDKIVWLSALTYFLLIALLIFSYYISKGLSRMIVSFIGIAALVLLTWTLIDNKIMDYQDANIGLGLVFFLVWIIAIFMFLFALIMLFRSKRQG
ncbi:potassium transporter Kef [Solibacillus sp. FSL K6-1781]|uniref:potassium transporter Kef n=1 Tax=Solibacillus sp. FSL K6-1781 TaxID=2921474 RepID=UPI00315AE39C